MCNEMKNANDFNVHIKDNGMFVQREKESGTGEKRQFLYTRYIAEEIFVYIAYRICESIVKSNAQNDFN